MPFCHGESVIAPPGEGKAENIAVFFCSPDVTPKQRALAATKASRECHDLACSLAHGSVVVLFCLFLCILGQEEIDLHIRAAVHVMHMQSNGLRVRLACGPTMV